jgi:hypothetical protein
MAKTNDHLGRKEEFVNLIKGIYINLRTSVIISGKRLNFFLLKLGTRQGCYSSHLCVTLYRQIRAICQEKEIKEILIEEKNKSIYTCTAIILYAEIPKIN